MAENKLRITPKLPKGEDGYKTFSIRIKNETAGRLDQLALYSGRSRNELIGILLECAIENCEIAKS